MRERPDMWATIKQNVFTWRVLFWTIGAGFVLGILAIIAFMIWMAALGRTVPSVEQLAEYNPPVTSRVHAGDGTLIYEFADEHRVFIPYEAMPEHVIHAFVSAEDKKYFEHGGVDPIAVLRASINGLRAGRIVSGASTISMQVARGMYSCLVLDRMVTYTIRPMALRMHERVKSSRGCT